VQELGNYLIYENDTLNIKVTAYDPDNDTLTISYQQPLNSSGSWTPKFNESGVYNITVIVSDGTQNVTKTANVIVLNLNRAPVISNATDITVTEGETINLSFTAVTDPDNDSLSVSYSHPLNSRGVWVTGNGDAGIYKVNITATDGQYTTIKTFTLNVNPNYETFNMTLVRGWNLVSFPFENIATWNADDITKNITNSLYISKFDKNTKKYLTHPVNTPVENFVLSSNEGYFVYVNANITYTFKGRIKHHSFSELNLTAGWNIISHANTSIANAEDYCGLNNSLKYMASYDNNLKKFITHPCNTPVDNFNLERFKAYFIFVS